MTAPFATRGRRAPYSQLGDWVVVSGVPGVSVAVYWALEAMTWRIRDEDGEATEIDRFAEPSRETLAEMFGFSRPQSIDPYLEHLERVGAIDKISVPGHPNRYVVHQTPPDDYEGPQTMGQWHKRRAARKKAEAASRAAGGARGGKAQKAAGSTSSESEPAAIESKESQVNTCAPERTSPVRTYALQRTGGVRSSAHKGRSSFRPR